MDICMLDKWACTMVHLAEVQTKAGTSSTAREECNKMMDTSMRPGALIAKPNFLRLAKNMKASVELQLD